MNATYQETVDNHGTTREGVLNLFDAITGADLSDDDNAGSEGEDI